MPFHKWIPMKKSLPSRVVENSVSYGYVLVYLKQSSVRAL